MVSAPLPWQHPARRSPDSSRRRVLTLAAATLLLLALGSMPGSPATGVAGMLASSGDSSHRNNSNQKIPAAPGKSGDARSETQESAVSSGPYTSFGTPVKLTPTGGGGYEPATVAGFGDIFVTAHKENAEDALAPDSGSQSGTRSSSWAWASFDGGKTFSDIPGLPLNLENRQVGDEGDFAFDDAGHLYFVDTNIADNNLTRWTVRPGGASGVSLDFTRPVIPTAQAVDDRPWITAHGNGYVFYFGNEGDKVTYPLGQGAPGSGPGRYTVYRSTNGGLTFDPTGYTLPDSGWCRPAADHTPGSPYVYAVCTNDGGSNDLTDNCPCDPGTIWAYVSADNGQTFSRYKVGNYEALDSTGSWPIVQVAPDGSLYALYIDSTKLDANNNPIGNKVLLFHSEDHGKTWSQQNITPMPGRYHYSWLSVSPDGKYLGVGLYYRPDNTQPWFVYGSVFKPGQKPALTRIDPIPVAPPDREASGDLMGCSFNSDDSLNVVYTRDVITVPHATLFRDIYFARSVTADQEKSESPAGGQPSGTSPSTSIAADLPSSSSGALPSPSVDLKLP